MTRLELVQMLARECRLPSVPTSTINQVGEYLQAVEDIDSAYAEIQRKAGGTWLFLVNDFSFTTVAGTGNYPKAGIVGLNHRRWKEDSFRIYNTVADEDWLYYLSWPDFRYIYVKGSDRTTQGRPSYFSIKPDKSIQLYPIPDREYTVLGELWRSPYKMEADTDTPAWPDRDFDEIIVWKALEYWAAREEEPNRELFAVSKFRSIYLDLRDSELPALEWGPPLA